MMEDTGNDLFSYKQAFFAWLSCVKIVRNGVFPNRTILMLHSNVTLEVARSENREELNVNLRILELGAGLHSLVICGNGYCVGIFDKDTHRVYMLNDPLVTEDNRELSSILGIEIGQIERTGISSRYGDIRGEQIADVNYHLTNVMNILTSSLADIMQRDIRTYSHPIHDLIALLWEPARNGYLEVLLTGLFVCYAESKNEIQIDVNSIKRIGQKWDRGLGPWDSLLQFPNRENWGLSPRELLYEYVGLMSNSAIKIIEYLDSVSSYSTRMQMIDIKKELYKRFETVVSLLEETKKNITAFVDNQTILQSRLPGEVIQNLTIHNASELIGVPSLWKDLVNRESSILSGCMQYAALIRYYSELMPNLLKSTRYLTKRQFRSENDLRVIPATIIWRLIPLTAQFEYIVVNKSGSNIYNETIRKKLIEIDGTLKSEEGIHNWRNRTKRHLDTMIEYLPIVNMDNRWYGETELVNYLRISCARKEVEIINPVSSYEQFNKTLEQIINGTIDQGAQRIIIPMNVNVLSSNFEEGRNNHWVGLVIDRNRDGYNVNYVDPMGSQISDQATEALNTVLGVKRELISHVFKEENRPQYAKIIGEGEWRMAVGNTNDCGPFLVWALTEIISDRNPVNGLNRELLNGGSTGFGQRLREQQREILDRQNQSVPPGSGLN